MVDLQDKSYKSIGPARQSILTAVQERYLCPPDKSFTHRAFIFAALAKGRSKIVNPLLGEDCLATKKVFEQLGCRFLSTKDDKGWDVVGVDSPGVKDWDLGSSYKFDFENSGTTARLLLGLFSGVAGLKCDCDGDESLRKRPMRRVTEFLKEMGADLEGEDNANFLPISIAGKKLTPGNFTYTKASAQVKSALLLAGLNLEGTQIVRLPKGGRDHTENFLKSFGANLRMTTDGEDEVIELTGPVEVEATQFHVPGDPSSAAFIAALHFFAGRKTGCIDNVMKNETRSGFFRALEKLGVEVIEEPCATSDNIEQIVNIRFEYPLKWKEASFLSSEIPAMIDEVPILALMCSYLDGTFVFKGLQELKVKESDRLQATADLITTSGGTVEIAGDDLIVNGRRRMTVPFEFDSGGDHRIAMAACCMALKGDSDSTIRGTNCINVSFPNFFDVLDTFR